MTPDLLERLKAALAAHYTVEREIGRGGMARVFLALELHPSRQVAVKVLEPALAQVLGPERFLREVDLASKMTYPNIMPIFAAGEADGLLYYVMPYVPGESLRRRLDREKQLPLEDALRIAEEVAGALNYAHQHGVIHRDIKPENILLQSGHAMVADFGIARAITAAGGERLTETGLVVGSPAYMSPEQSAGDRDLDPRSDLYSLAAVLYETLAGVPPITGATVQAILARRLSQPAPPIRAIRESVPAPVERAILRSLERAPADRFGSAQEFAAALRQSGDALVESGATRGIAPSPRRALPLGPAGWLGLAGLLVVIGTLLFRPGPHAEIRFGPRSQVTLDPGLEVDPAVSPDGRLVAYAAGPLPAARLFVKQIDGSGTPVPLATGAAGPQRLPYWSPEGRRIAFLSPRGIEIVSALGGAPRLLVPNESRAAMLPGPWSPDGAQVSFARSDSLFLVAADASGAPRLLAHGGDMHSFAWSPDGRWIALVRGNRQSIDPAVSWFYGNLGQSAIWLVPIGGGEPVRVTDERSMHATPGWLPGGSLLYLSNAQGGLELYRVGLNRSGAPTGEANRLTTGLNARAVSLSADGRRLAYAAFVETSNVYSLPVPAGGPASVSQAQPITSGNQVVETFDVSPDGHWLAFDSDRSGMSVIYRMPVAGGEPEQLTSDSSDDFWARWSPDGREIAYLTFRGGIRRLMTMTADGRNPAPITAGGVDERAAEWRRDGGGVYYLYRYDTPDPEVRFASRNSAGEWGRPTTIIKGDALPVSLSPNGRWLAFSGSAGLTLTGLSGDSARVLVPVSYRSNQLRPTYISWAADSHELYYLALDSLSRASIWSIAPPGGQPRLRVRFDDPHREWHRYGFRANGGRFYFTIGDRQSDIWSMTASEQR